MDTITCIKTRRSIRTFKPDKVDYSLLKSIISVSSFAPSWKNTQITRYTIIDNPSIRDQIIQKFTPEYNANNIKEAPLLLAVTMLKERSGFERDGSFTTKKGDRWQMFDVGVACQTFSLAAHEAGLGSVIMGVFDEDAITTLLNIPKEQELVALIAVGYPATHPVLPKRKTVDELLTII